MSDKWTAENGKCFFGNHPEEGYARQDDSGEWQPACYSCAKKPYVHFVNKKDKRDKTSS